MKNIFTKHPNEAGESYFGHFCFAFGIGVYLIFCGFVAICHSIFPFIFTFTASNNVKRINEIMQKRAAILRARLEESKVAEKK